jgi:predicted PurR-regulated permease PerM
VLNPVIMSRTVKINPLLVLLSILVGTSISGWLGGSSGSFAAALLSISVAGACRSLPGALADHRTAGTARRRAGRRSGARSR